MGFFEFLDTRKKLPSHHQIGTKELLSPIAPNTRVHYKPILLSNVQSYQHINSKHLLWRSRKTPTSWAPTSYKWTYNFSYNPYKWPYKWVSGVVTLHIGVITPFITGSGAHLVVSWFNIKVLFKHPCSTFSPTFQRTWIPSFHKTVNTYNSGDSSGGFLRW